MAGAAELTSSTRDLLAWIADRPRTYAETMEAWRSSCPRHTVWEDALGERLLEVVGGTGADGNGGVTLRVALTPRGRAALASRAS